MTEIMMERVEYVWLGTINLSQLLFQLLDIL